MWVRENDFQGYNMFGLVKFKVIELSCEGISETKVEEKIQRAVVGRCRHDNTRGNVKPL
jgi:hypothetical protein